MALKNNTWKVNQWYDQAVAGNISYTGEGQLWTVGRNAYGTLGQNESGYIKRSSPVQIPGTTWNYASGGGIVSMATKTDGTLWSWGISISLGLNQPDNTHQSSPCQVGTDTTWKSVALANPGTVAAIKTDGTLWSWGYNNSGQL